MTSIVVICSLSVNTCNERWVMKGGRCAAIFGKITKPRYESDKAEICNKSHHCAKKPVTTMLTYPWKCTVLHCNHLGNTWKPLVLMTRHFDYCPSASEGDNQSVGSSAPVVSRCFPGGYNVKLYISRGRLACGYWLFCTVHDVTFLIRSL